MIEVVSLQELIEDLLRVTGASRVTLRQAHANGFFGITHEALAVGAPSVTYEHGVDLRTNQTVLEIQQLRQVVQNDSRQAHDDPDWQRMLELYGGLAAQIVTPIVIDGQLAGIISVHQLGQPRTWTTQIDECRRAAARAAELLASNG